MNRVAVLVLAGLALCAGAHRVAGGKGVTGGGEIVCREVPQPSCAR